MSNDTSPKSIFSSKDKAKALTEKLFQSPCPVSTKNLKHIVSEIHSKAASFKKIALNHQTPCYVFDSANLKSSLERFKAAFSALPNISIFYAVKVNHYHPLLCDVFSFGFGADVSSGRELTIAKNAGASSFVFSGPGKTKAELETAIADPAVIINIDSFSELRKIISIAMSHDKAVKAGVRISIDEQGSWTKFGIPLDALEEFCVEAMLSKAVLITGIQVHMSWNEDAQPYETAIKKIYEYLSKHTEEKWFQELQFIDIGGGFRPYNSEGHYPEDTPHGAAYMAACDAFGEEPQFSVPYIVTEAPPIEAYGRSIVSGIQNSLAKLKNFSYYLEPGRIIVNNALHVLLRVEDVKGPQCIITDGGTNIIGFERFEFDYFPLINLTNPSLDEIRCSVFGSLCMPQDYWGHHLYASKVEEGDLIVVPYQGALTYANMQGFIKGEAPVFEL